MCLAIPARIARMMTDNKAIVDIGGVEREISTALLDQVAINDYVVVHVGYALALLDEQEAKKTLELFSEMLQGNE